MTRNARLRFLDNNLNDSTTATITYSSQLSTTYAASNTREQMRSRVWKPSGQFYISSSNCSVYVNDGSNRTATISSGSYATGSALATAVQTALNAVSSNWACTYSSTTYRFTITRSSGTGNLRLSQTSNAAWDTLGFTGSTDRTSANYLADEVRIHTSEWYQIDLGSAYPVSAIAAIGPIDEAFGVSYGATVRLMGSNVDGLWTAPGLTVTLTADYRGVFGFLDDQSDYTYRFWRFEVVDRTNAAGPSALKVGHLYIGDYVTLTTSNVAQGFSKDPTDQTVALESENGARYFRTLPKFRRFSGASLQNVLASERRALEEMFERIGLDQAFYLSLDPTLAISTSLSELTAFGRFATMPRLTNIIRDYYTVAFDFQEAV